MNKSTKKLSGSANRKRAHEKDEKERMVISKVPKILAFLEPKETSSHSNQEVRSRDIESTSVVDDNYHDAGQSTEAFRPDPISISLNILALYLCNRQ